ncbi:MAG: DNA-3-methyladenine glycosylase [Clostridia bacterium]|nr:DNA-3-methyladenine glycosylase [Clostridia bacterium]
MRISSSLFRLPADQLAPLLIGKLLCRRTADGVLRQRIVETECYLGEEDSACHAHRGKTSRNAPLYLPGGYSYVYLCYGIHNLLNIVSGFEGHPEAVLIRGVEGYIGPGRLTKALSIDRSLNAIDLTVSDELWLEDDGTTLPFHTAPRVGIDYADPADRERLWRHIADP